MSTTVTSAYHVPTIEVTEPSDGHLLPFITGMVLVLLTVVASIAMVGMPH